ncbi:hypothetical protein KEF85_15585 [Methylomonas paludis]|uniref:Nucleoside phosphorylase domain-containing protein n=1 Tax=Methylomonas paludis TaxID=1173101 RepID=A0A975MMW2_9GAMM|nr:hypothetical protein [Methylomonas paludis]QWF70722.1 hypothetical protein KEF85_15585 [Methylomonas paludis]
MAPSLFIFVALQAEAKPLIQHLGLKKSVETHPFTIYTSHDTVLVLTGMGKIAMAGAVGYAMAKFAQGFSPIMLNIGIAGHRQHDLGACYLADKILNTATGRTFYPQFPFRHNITTTKVLSFAKPQADYSDDGLYDMEAAGFYEIAARFSTSELIHCIKIVSDNRETPLADFNLDRVNAWIDAHLPGISLLIDQLRRCRPHIAEIDDEDYRHLVEQYHFTAANAIKLKNLWQRRLLLCPDIPLELEGLQNARQVLLRLEAQLQQAFYL